MTKGKSRTGDKRAASTPATAALAQLGIPYAIHAYRHDPDTTE